MTPLVYKVLRKRDISHTNSKIFFRYIKTTIGLHRMLKNSGGYFSSIEVDTVTGEYHVVIPEWVINEMDWYEDTKLSFKTDGGEVIITESDE